jgi:cytochrome P450
LKSAPVLNAFIAESWRKDPPVTIGFRRTVNPQEYQGFKFPERQGFMYSILLASQNEKLYPQPLNFDIQRFLPQGHPLVTDTGLNMAAEKIDFNSMKANYPIFGGGMHACLGSHFAKLEMRIFLTRLLQSYDIEERNAEKVNFPINGFKTEFRVTPL